ncbi:MAG: hypothetical protein A4E73_02993 [Syntrophaceae bacterium PtaU1.Bin231]|nr:MAG: hypothetical protein A4E73_02993 [Syntrophaceae bacterium PtaU1.Bin231]
MKKILICIFLCLAAPAWGQEFSLLGGIVRNTDSGDHANAFQIEYRDRIEGPVGFSISYLNQGHFPENHRDGVLAQLWWQVPLARTVFLTGGLGPYFWFDTNERFTGPVFKNQHGLGIIFSLAADWHLKPPFFLQAQTNWILTENNIDTLSLLVGIGLELDRTAEKTGEPPPRGSNRNEIAAYIGRMIANNSDTKSATSWGVEYRRDFGKHIGWTVSVLDEGDNDSLHRQGIASQVWAVDSFYGDRLTLGIGLGPYLSRNRDRDSLSGKTGDVLGGLLSVSASYRFRSDWAVRTTWHRVITDHDRDADVFLIGPAFRF